MAGQAAKELLAYPSLSSYWLQPLAFPEMRQEAPAFAPAAALSPSPRGSPTPSVPVPRLDRPSMAQPSPAHPCPILLSHFGFLLPHDTYFSNLLQNAPLILMIVG